MANDNKNRFNPENLMEQLTTTAVGLKIDSVVFSATTKELGDHLVGLLQRNGIWEADHCLLYPVTNNSGMITSFNAVVIFNSNNGSGGNKPNIIRGKGFNKKGKNGERANLMNYVNNRNVSGGETFTDDFKKCVGAIARFDDNGEMITHTRKDNPNILLIECDFFLIVSLILAIEEKSPLDYEIIECTPLNGGKGEVINYKLKIAKEVSQNNRRGKSSGFNYNYMDKELISSMTRR